MRHFVKYDLIPLLSILAVCAFPCVFLYARNAAEVPASSMLPFLVVFTVTAALILGALSPFLRNVSRAAFLTDLAMLVVINFCLLAVNLKKVLPFMRDRYLLAVLALVLLAVLVLLIKKKPDMRVACLLVLIAFGTMIVMNYLVLGVPAILTRHEVRGYMEEQGPGLGHRPPPGGSHGESGDAGAEDLSGVVFEKPDRPNVYFFLFDEYGGPDNLAHYYDYDLEPFLEELEGQGFSVSRHSVNTESIHTDTLVPNILNLSYAVRVDEPYHKKAALRNNCQLFQMFAANGYQINLINHVDYIGPAGCRVLTSHQTRRTISEFLMRNSIFQKSKALRAYLEEFFVIDYGANYRASLDNALNVSLTCWQETGGQPTLTMGYIQCPHSPTMVGPHGEALPFAEGWNWRRPELYLGQVDFINDFLRQLLTQLRENDPTAIIILQSDHGNRYALHMVDIGEWESYDPHVENPYMQNILDCVYVPGRTLDIEGKNSINTLRYVFSEVFGADLPEVEPVVDFTDMSGDEKQ